MSDELRAGDVIMISPTTGGRSGNSDFAGLLAFVDEVKPWGVKCTCRSPESDYSYRVANGEFQRVGEAPYSTEDKL